jgi:hypothetical protein
MSGVAVESISGAFVCSGVRIQGSLLCRKDTWQPCDL